MENTNRIRSLRNQLGLSQTDFGNRLGVSRDVVNNIENNRVPLKPALAKLICNEFGVDPFWLETGEGEMFLEKDDLESLLDFAKAMHTDKDLAWLRVLCEYIAGLSPEERSDVSRYVSGIAAALQGKEKEQE